MFDLKPLAATMALIGIAGAAQAATVDHYTLEAESTSSSYSDFWLDFEDTDGDGKFGSGDHVHEFGGISHYLVGGLLGEVIEVKYDLFDTLDWKLDLVGTLLDDAGYLVWDVGEDLWNFKKETLLTTEWLIANVSDFKYKLLHHDNENPSPVPLPATGLMLVGALAGLAAMRRRVS